jgi:ATP-dependent RNA helicase DeaD
MSRFRITWGQAHGATARRLVAMLCRRGGIESKDIGAIEVHRNYATVEVSSAVAQEFFAKAGVADPRDPRVTVRPEVPVARKSGGAAPPKRVRPKHRPRG